MDNSKRMSRSNPKETANIISRLFFWWTMKLFWKGAHRDLELADLYDPLKCDESETLADRLEREWQKELVKLNIQEYMLDKDGNKKKKNGKKPSLSLAIVRTFWFEYLWCGMLQALQAIIFRTVQPLFQGWVIGHFNASGSTDAISEEGAVYYGTGLVLATFGVIFCLHHSNLSAQQIGMRVRVACCSLVYRKTLRLSKAALGQTTAGQIVNMLSNDVNRFDLVPLYLHYIWIMPFQIVVIGYIMWQSVGISTLVGIGSVMLLSIPIQGYLSKLSAHLRAVIAGKTDKRVGFMSELIVGIQVVKMYAWEKPFEKIVSMTRASEMKVITFSSYMRGLYLSIMVFTERTSLFLTLLAFVLMGNTLTAQITFVLSSYFNTLQLILAMFFPQAIILAGEGLVSIKRLETFFLLEEVERKEDEVDVPKNSNYYNNIAKKEVEYLNLSVDAKQPCRPVTVELHRLSANWICGQLPPTLCNVNMKLEGGKLCALVGIVGSGKSSLLNVLLKELPVGAGNVLLLQNNGLGNGDDSTMNSSQRGHGYITDNPKLRISYFSQDPWLFAGTVRENILFGQPYDKSRYQQVTRVCALLKDFEQLPQRDLTIVGERGTSLSGGQRARVNLARAVYRQADLYLLDDPLSAVDTHVGRQLFEECIEGYLHGKTRILVTHQLQYLKQADTIAVLDHGTVKLQGSFDELSKKDTSFTTMLENMHIDEEEELDERNHEDQIERKSMIRTFSSRRTSVRSSKRSSSYAGGENIDHELSRNGINEEEVAKGQMSSKIYLSYFKAGGSTCLLVILSINFIMAQVATSGADYWVTYWTNIETVRSEKDNGSISDSSDSFWFDDNGILWTNICIYIYTICIVSCILLSLSRSFLFMRVCMSASRNLHNAMFANIQQATMQFFNSNPSGRILNRFSKDVGSMDELLPKAMLEATQIFLVMIGILTMVAIVNYWMIIPMIIIAVIFYFVRIYYLKTAQNVKRLEGVTKSPVFSHVSATLNGLTTIRSRGRYIESKLRREFDQYQDCHSGAWYLTLATAISFGFILDMISACFLACVIYSFILMDNGSTFGGNVGLAISQSLVLTGMLQYGVRQSADVVSQMTSVERVLQYTNLPKEGPMTTKNPPPSTWPSCGNLTMKNVYMRYNQDDPPTLKNLNVNIEAGWKVGIIGRTGAGKSSLISALFRLTGDGLEGEIKIDDIDTATIGLHEIRPCISIIPQEPVLFSASLRYNLDPFGRYPDSALWEALKEVEMNDFMLDMQVAGGGQNFSVGQRQLICLARAILRNNRILVLDEATANIDLYTDSLIQRTIRTKFKNCTVLTIAHRLNTIIDSDRVLVMDAGRIVEFGYPYELLRNRPDGHFAQMVQQTGEAMANNLNKLAEIAYKDNMTYQQNFEPSHSESSDSDNAALSSSKM